jgi:hypothetical protein
MSLFSVLIGATLSVASADNPQQPDAQNIAQASAMLAQIVIERQTYIRITPARQPQVVPLDKLKEHGGPKCITASALAGIMIRKPDSIDLLLRGGQMMRAKLEKGCPSVDFYSGFYMKPSRDGRICRGRDMIHSRTGGSCEIEKFKTLLPAK